jgi:hypothetical protein
LLIKVAQKKSRERERDRVGEIALWFEMERGSNLR